MADLEKNPSLAKSLSQNKVNSNPKFAGVTYPLPKNGSVGFAVDNHAINASIRQILMTEPGERLFEPQFGTPLRRMMFQPQDDLIYSDIMRVVGASIQKWEPRITIVSPSMATGGQVNGPTIKVGSAYNSENEPIDHTVMVSFFWSFKDNLEDVFLFESSISRAVTSAQKNFA